MLLAPDADEPELTLELDGASVGRAVLGAATPVDPGTHVVRASAPGKQPWQQSIEVGAVADQQSLTVPKLEIAAAPEAAPAPTAPGPAAPAPPASPPSPERDHLPRPIPTSVYVSGGITLGLLAGAGVTGLVYQNKREDHDDLEPGSDPDEVQRRKDSALRWGYVNMGMWIGAAVGASVTSYLFITRPTRPQTARLVPWAAPGSAGLSVTGGF